MAWNFNPWSNSPMVVGGNIDVMPSMESNTWPSMTPGDQIVVEYPNNARDSGEILAVTSPNDSPIKFQVNGQSYTAILIDPSPMKSSLQFATRVYKIT